MSVLEAKLPIAFYDGRTNSARPPDIGSLSHSELPIYLEQVQNLASTAKTTVAVNLLNGTLLAVLLVAGPIPTIIGIGWLFLLLLSVLWRVHLITRTPSEQNSAALLRWVKLYACSSLATGSVWGLAGLSLYVDLNVSLTILVILVLAGMAAGAAATNSAYAPAAVLFIAPALLPGFTFFASRGTDLGFAMAFMALVFFITLVKVSKTIETSIVKAISSDKRGEELSENLAAIADYSYAWESWLADDGKLRWVNPSVERVTGYSPDDCWRMSDYPLPIIHKDDRENVARAISNMDHNQEPSYVRCRIRTKDNRTRWIAVDTQPARDSKGAPFGFRISVRDTTEQVELTEKLAELAQTDPLTGLNNRRTLSEICEHEIARSRRFNRPFSVALLDIDRFKEINDTYGHLAGDECLKALAETMSNNVRGSDLAARYGGEEFVVTMPETDAHQAQMISDRLRQRVEELSVTFGSDTMKFTVSIGVAQLKPNENIDELFERADASLYRAKENGRNRVVVDDTVELVFV